MEAGSSNGSERIDVAVIGAGVVGLAVARSLARAGRDVLVIESETAIGTGTSSRNSEVVHAGIYYPPGSLKALLCVAGRPALYAYCRRRGIAHARLGKLLVATQAAEMPALAGLERRARANGVHDLAWLDEAEVRSIEPAIRCRAAILSPSTGIVDSHALMLAYRGDLEAAGGMIAFGARSIGGTVAPPGVRLTVEQNGRLDLICRTVVNCAGLQAQAVAGSIRNLPGESVPPRHLAKGSYFRLSGRAPFRHLIYPMPGGGGAGVHLTLDLSGQARFGPDIEWLDEPDYAVDPRRAERFYAAIRRYWPALPDDSLVPDYAGIRPKLHDAAGGDADFVIQGADRHGVPGLVNLYGIESPGLTASLAIAEYVKWTIMDHGDGRPARDQAFRMHEEKTAAGEPQV